MSTAPTAIAVIGIDIGKNSFHIVGLDDRGARVLRQKWSRCQVETRLANLRPCLIGMEACVGAHHLSRKLKALGHDARLMPARYVRPYSKGQTEPSADDLCRGVQAKCVWQSIVSAHESTSSLLGPVPARRAFSY
jgi:transposase